MIHGLVTLSLSIGLAVVLLLSMAPAGRDNPTGKPAIVQILPAGELETLTGKSMRVAADWRVTGRPS
mgnify:CR=1 FL=1